MRARRVLILIFILSAGSAGASALAAEHAGVVTRLRGEAAVMRGAEPHALGVNAEVLVSDHIVTGAKARLEIRLHDGGVITIGERTALSVHDYHHAAGKEKAHAVFGLAQGAVHSVTGSVFKNSPDSVFQIRTGIAIIGARGTEFWVGLEPDFVETVLFEGKSLEVENDHGRVLLPQPGLGTDAKPGAAPAPPKAWGAKRLQKARDSVAWD